MVRQTLWPELLPGKKQRKQFSTPQRLSDGTTTSNEGRIMLDALSRAPVSQPFRPVDTPPSLLVEPTHCFLPRFESTAAHRLINTSAEMIAFQVEINDEHFGINVYFGTLKAGDDFALFIKRKMKKMSDEELIITYAPVISDNVVNPLAELSERRRRGELREVKITLSTAPLPLSTSSR